MSFTKSQKSDIMIEREVMVAERILSTGKRPTEAMIREQFKLIAKANHPDHGGCGEGTYTMEKLQWAKKTLIDNLESRNASK